MKELSPRNAQSIDEISLLKTDHHSTKGTTETKPLTKHIQTAVNAIQKQIDKYEKQRLQLLSKAGQLERQAETITDSIEGLSQQISKLKGE